MKVIKNLVEDIQEELEGAEHYANRSAGNEPPEAMQAIWDWEHKKAVDTTAMVKQLLAMYKGA